MSKLKITKTFVNIDKNFSGYACKTNNTYVYMYT